MRTKILTEDMKGRDHLIDLGIDERTILKMYFRKIGSDRVV
jgi:hypothetical protein